MKEAAESIGETWYGGPYEPTAITRAETRIELWMPTLQSGPARIIAEFLTSPFEP